MDSAVITTPEHRMDFDQIRALGKPDMLAVDQIIHNKIQSGVPTIPALGTYLIASGGKRLRPLLLCLATRLFGYSGDRHHALAAAVEFIHSATLLHDDVVDGSQMRRNQATANQIWGNAASVLVGDFLYTRAFEILVADGDLRVLEIMAKTTCIISEGEVQQLENVQNAELDEAGYLAVIQSKTAKLFEAATQLGAVVNRATSEQENALADYGRYLGTAFQLIDDALDYSAQAETIGKNIGDDLAEGKPTLPFIHAMHKATAQDQAILREALQEGGLDRLAKVLDIIAYTGAIQYTAQRARQMADRAKSALLVLPDGPHREALAFLADFSVDRDF